jgi:shikimate dehydrogenase
LQELADSGGRGCNITLPLKRHAWELAHRSSDAAARACAANTLVYEGAGAWSADNTDGRGLIDDLERQLGGRLAAARICLLGAGGAAAGILGALLGAGPQEIVIANRTLERAVALAGRHADLGAVESCTPDGIEARGPFDLLVNATSLGHLGEAPLIDRQWLSDGGLCYDLNYGPAAEPLRKVCASTGLPYSDGLGMLVGQAALSFELWTGQLPDTTAVLEALR